MMRKLSLSCFSFALAVLIGCSGKSQSDTVQIGEEGTSSNAAGKKEETLGDQLVKKAFNTANFAKVPDDFPKDVVVSDSWSCQSSMRKDNSFMLSFNTESKTYADVVQEIKSGMAGNGWQLTGALETAASSIFPFTKDKRTCGITVTAKTMNQSGQLDPKLVGISIQTKK